MSIIDQKNNNNSKIGGKMNFIRFGKKIPHTITNIPSSGVYLGFSSYESSVIFHIISLRKLRLPSSSLQTNDGAGVMRCIAYSFNGEFKNNSYDHRDEDGKEIPNIREYYK